MDIDILIDPSSSYSVIKSVLLTNIRSKIRTEDGYDYHGSHESHGSHACYRVAVSAHGSDTTIVKSTKKNRAVDVDLVFTFQQMKHALPSYECDQGSVSELSNSDFRIHLYHIISQIVFENPDILNRLDVVQKYQRQLFRTLYQRQLELSLSDVTKIRDYEAKYGPVAAKTFVDVTNASHHVIRNYSITPGSLAGKNYQLEYVDNTRERIWLLPGISVASRLIEMSGSKKLGIECNRITGNYGVFVDHNVSSVPYSHSHTVSNINVDIYDIAAQVHSMAATSTKQFIEKYNNGYDSARLMTTKKSEYENTIRELNTKQMVGFISKYTDMLKVPPQKTTTTKTKTKTKTKLKPTPAPAPAPKLKIIPPSQSETDMMLMSKIEYTNDGLMDALMSFIDNDNPLRVVGKHKTIGDFFGLFNGNLNTWLMGKAQILSGNEIDKFIEEIALLSPRVIMGGEGHKHELFKSLSELDAIHLIIFIRKVYLLNEFRSVPFYSVDIPNLSVSSHDIASLLELHCAIITTSEMVQPTIYIMDQVCRVCNSGCVGRHELPLAQVDTPKTPIKISPPKSKKGGFSRRRKSIREKRKKRNLTHRHRNFHNKHKY